MAPECASPRIRELSFCVRTPDPGRSGHRSTGRLTANREMSSDYFLIMVGAVLGANARYLVSLWAAHKFGPAFPLGTLVVNVTGSLLLGFTAGLAAWWPAGPALSPLVAVGFCGSYTTFSTLAYETVALVRQRSVAAAVTNVLASVLLGVAGAALGAHVARSLVAHSVR